MARRAVYTSLVAVVAASAAFALGSAQAGGAGSKPLKGVQFAIVSSDGTLQSHSKGVTGSEKFDTGYYYVRTKGDGLDCVAAASQGASTGNQPPTTSGEATVSSGSDPAVSVRTFDEAGNAANRGFHVIIAC